MRHRWFAWILRSPSHGLAAAMCTSLLACAAAPHVSESPARPRIASRVSAPKEEVAPRRKVSASAPRKPASQPARDAKASFSPGSALDDESDSETEADSASESSAEQHAVAVAGIEGTMSEYDVRTTLEGRGQDFDRCHGGGRGGSGRIEFRIHILSNGEVGDVKVHHSKVHNREIVDCYADVVMASRFSAPHGGYADVKWSTKVGRSPKRPDEQFERRVRWDAPSSSRISSIGSDGTISSSGSGSLGSGGSSSQTTRSEHSESRRERRHHHRHH